MSAPRPFHLLNSTLRGTNFYIYRTVFQIFSPSGTLRCVLMQSIFNNCARALARPHISRLRPVAELLLFFHTERCSDYWRLRMRFNENIKQPFRFTHVFLCLFLDSKQIFFFQLCNFILSNPIIQEIIHGESRDMEFFYQSDISQVRVVIFHILQAMQRRKIVKMVNLGKEIENEKK